MLGKKHAMVGLRSLRDLVPPYYLMPAFNCDMPGLAAPV